MAARDIQELAAKIAEIEAAGTGRSRRPLPRSDAAAGDLGSTGPWPAAGGLVSGGIGDTSTAATADPRIDPTLPSRDVDELGGPALADLSGQLAHDEALGVAPDGRPLDPGEEGESRGRKRKPKPAELAFSEAMPHQRAIELAYKLVSQRERTAKQVREKLAAKGCEPPEIEAAIDELARHGFLDDRRYAKMFAEDKRRLQGWGARRIRMDLGRAGVSREILDELFSGDEEGLDAPSELDAALELLRRKRPDLTDPKVKQRMASMLARRGIASSTVFAAIRQHARGDD